MSVARRILVVGNDPAARKNIEEVLSGKGHAIVTASSGEDALWKLGDGAYAAVFTDLVMRGMSGLEVAEEIRVRQPGLPVVIVAGEGTGAVPERAASAGVAEFLHAPVTRQRLAETVDRVLQSSMPSGESQPRPPVAGVASAEAPSTPIARLKGIALFLLAPFVGLAYIVIFPVVGLGILASLVQQEPERAEPSPAAAPARLHFFRTVGTMIAVALAGVACAVVAPVLGIGLLLWCSLEAWGKLGAKAIRG